MRKEYLLLTSALLALCTSCRGVQLTQTSFLANHDQLEDQADDASRRLYVRADVDWSRYDGVTLAPLEFHLVPESESLSESRRESLAEYMEERLREKLEKRFTILDVPRDGTFTVRAAVTDVDRTSLALNGVLAILLLPLDTGGATVELELVDATSGERLAALVNADRGRIWNMVAGMSPIGHAKQSLAEAAEWVAQVTGAAAAAEAAESDEASE